MKKKFTKKENSVLSEIYRRLNYFHGGNVEEKLMYLALPSEAKVIAPYGLITPYSKEVPKNFNWYKLTEKGKLFFSNYKTKNKLDSKLNNDIFDDKYIKEFDYSLV